MPFRIIDSRFSLPDALLDLLARDDPPSQVFVEFNLSRSPLLLARFGSAIDVAEDEWHTIGFPDSTTPSLPPNVRQLVTGDEARIESADRLRVRTRGETVQVVAFYVETRSGKQYNVEQTNELGEHCPEADPPEYQVTQTPVAWSQPPALKPQAYLDKMRARIPYENDSAQKDHFFQLDERSHPHLLPLLKPSICTIEDIDHTFSTIELDMRRRAEKLVNGYSPVLEEPWKQMKAFVEPLATMQRGLIDANFQNLDAYEEAFRKFANGELRFQVINGLWTTQPSGAGFFLFGEFAIITAKFARMANDASSEEYWTRVAGIRVGAQRIYAAAYPAITGPAVRPTYSHYGTCSFTEPLKDTTKAPKIDAKASLDEIEVRAAENFRDAFPGLLP